MKPRYGTISYKGHVVTLPHNLQMIADILPNLPSELPIVVFQSRDRDNKNFNFKVRRNNVLKAICWLQKHNVLYKSVVIDMERGNQLPGDDYLDVCSISIKKRSNSSDAYDCGAVEDKESDSFIESSSFLPAHTNSQPKELHKLKEALEPNLTAEFNENALSEFTNPSIASMAFPALFADGVGYPTNRSTIRSISDNDIKFD